MSEWKPKPYQPHQSWAGQGPKTALVVDDPQYHKYPPGKGPYPGNLSKSAYDAERRASGKMSQGEAARYDHSKKIGQIMREGEASRQKSLKSNLPVHPVQKKAQQNQQFQTKSKQTLLTQQKKGEVPKTKGNWQKVIRDQARLNRQEKAAGRLGTKMRNLMMSIRRAGGPFNK